MDDPEMLSDLAHSGMLHQLMDHITDNIYFMDREGRIVLISQWGARWLGFESPEEVIGKTDYDLFTKEHAEAAYADEQRIMETGEPMTGIVEKETWEDGRVTWVSTTKMPLRDEAGKVIGLFGISRDVTEQHEHEELVKRMAEQMETELNRASEVQRSFLSSRRVAYPESPEQGAGSVEVVHEYLPSGPVGGDFFCLLPLSGNRLGIFIADVMGHGVGAALTMSALNAMARSEAARLSKPDAFLKRLNGRLRDVISNEETFEFITALYLVIDTTDGRATYATAGHHSPLVLPQGKKEVCCLFDREEVKGPALMLVPDPVFTTGECVLGSGDRVLLFTDGLTEVPARPGADHDVGLEGVSALLSGDRSSSLAELVGTLPEAILNECQATEFGDDLCLIGVEFKKGSE
jgi:sigma-B regulation protein RsbU (phosphoserine phosphatase)